LSEANDIVNKADDLRGVKFVVRGEGVFSRLFSSFWLGQRLSRQIRRFSSRAAKASCRMREAISSQNLQQRSPLSAAVKFRPHFMHGFRDRVSKSFHQPGRAPVRTPMVNLQSVGVGDHRRPDIGPGQAFADPPRFSQQADRPRRRDPANEVHSAGRHRQGQRQATHLGCRQARWCARR
jgi:hypothetical protein